MCRKVCYFARANWKRAPVLLTDMHYLPRAKKHSQIGNVSSFLMLDMYNLLSKSIGNKTKIEY